MFITNEQHRDSSPTPDAYDGQWLELIENPDAAISYREAPGSVDAVVSNPAPSVDRVG
jgi:hypothetical protein